jgi:hypothetical protein
VEGNVTPALPKVDLCYALYYKTAILSKTPNTISHTLNIEIDTLLEQFIKIYG